jgi:hypothetical protein
MERDIGLELRKEMENEEAGISMPQVPNQTLLEPKKQDPIFEQLNHEMKIEEHGTVAQTLLAGAEAVAQGFAGPVATAAEEALHQIGVPNLSPENRRLREESLGAVGSTAGQMFGFTAGLLTGTGQAKVLGKIGETFAHVVPIANKVGSKAIRAAVEMAAFGTGSQISKYLDKTPGQTVGTALTSVGLDAALGGGLSLAGSFWKATVGKKVSSELKSLADHYGGIEGVEKTALDNAIAESGLEIDSAVKASMTSPAGEEMALKLSQTDNKAGLSYQKRMSDFREAASQQIVEGLGRKVGEAPKTFDKHTVGTKLGHALAEDAKVIIDPAIKKFEEIEARYGSKKLPIDEIERVQTQESLANPYVTPTYTEIKRPGLMSQGVDKLIELGEREGWNKIEKSEMKKLLSEVIHDLPKQETVSDLKSLISYVGKKYNPLPGNSNLNYAVGEIMSVLKDVEIDALASFSKEPGVIQAARDVYKQAYQKLNPILAHLKIKNETLSGFGKRLKEMISEDAEGIATKLQAKNDVFLLDHLRDNFPHAAETLRQSYIDSVLSEGFDPAGNLSPVRLMNQIRKLSPQLQQFVMGNKEAQINSIGTMLDKFKNPKFNFSNTARTEAKNKKYWPATLALLSAELVGKGHIPSIGFATIAHLLTSEVPDAVRLGMLKWLGSNKSIDSAAFKAMTDFYSKSIRGENLVKRTSKAVFESGKRVLSDDLYPTVKQLDDLDKKLQEIQLNPSKLEKVGETTGYYLPDHGIKITSTLAQTANYLNRLRPREEKMGPLDPVIKPDKYKVQEYRRALGIAQQPLMTLEYLKTKQLTPSDMNHLRNLYPELAQSLSDQLMGALVEHLSQDKEIPFELKSGLSLFLGQPMDSALNKKSIALNQSAFAQHNQERAEKEAPKFSGSRMMKSKADRRVSLRLNDNSG